VKPRIENNRLTPVSMEPRAASKLSAVATNNPSSDCLPGQDADSFLCLFDRVSAQW
jgi:hypothetical protein